ncbi:hypothetical protein QZH41_015971 [Actinostola sp. cb2023]|nr:hypothetical protein QZH41_015971 [Actinostola sp. cb2023]
MVARSEFQSVYRSSFVNALSTKEVMQEFMEKKEYRAKRRKKDNSGSEPFVFLLHGKAEKSKMVFKSAYQRSFGRSKWDGFTMEEFQRKLQYRTDRRSVEHQHQAWLWDSDDEEEDVEEIPIDQGDKVNKHVTKKQTKPNDNERKKSVLAWVNEQQDVVGERKEWVMKRRIRRNRVKKTSSIVTFKVETTHSTKRNFMSEDIENLITSINTGLLAENHDSKRRTKHQWQCRRLEYTI